MRIPAIRLAVPVLLGLTASCAAPPPEAAAPPALAAAIAVPAPLIPPPPPSVIAAAAPVAVAAVPTPPPPEVEYVLVPFLWQRMLTAPLPAGRLMLNNFNFEPTRIQAMLVSGPACVVGDPAASAEFALPANGTGIVPAPPGFDICWRRALVPGETSGTPEAGAWAEWSRAYTGTGRFLDVSVIMPPAPPALAAAVANEPPAAPPTLPKYPPVEK